MCIFLIVLSSVYTNIQKLMKNWFQWWILEQNIFEIHAMKDIQKAN